ncbi:AAA family ATPase [Caulobacter sp. 17J65-9]|uniref:nucleotide-binding protein n=1 Tax=Caulobacter sp. 17J65-9 TaxID=2709382 RepID=UPI0013CD0CEA|nr:AAA family ATPase [Caulobacter sp. 17J65-9]NEX94090.1 AAA family ATPase [Caulobacter sp. 17J65-9]
MRTLAVLSRKGGTGKTTVAVQIAVAAAKAKRRVVVADLDPQRSALDWRRERIGDGPRVIEAKAGALFTLKQAEMRAGTDLLVLDTRSSNDQESAEAAREADFCVIVTRPCFFDVRSIQRTAELVNNLRKPAFIVLNQAPSRRNGEEPRLIRETVEMLDSYGLPVAPVGLRYRAAYQTAVRAGLAAQEMDPDSLAAFEINALWRHLKREIWPVQPKAVQPMVERMLGAA